MQAATDRGLGRHSGTDCRPSAMPAFPMRYLNSCRPAGMCGAAVELRFGLMHRWTYLLLAGACVPPFHSVEGSACDDPHPCPDGLACVDGRCSPSGEELGPRYYVSPSGDNA